MGDKHTPGPWFMFPYAHMDEGPGSFSIGTNQNNALADILCTRFRWPERAGEMEANGRLIATAPELLGALEEAVFWLTQLEAEKISKSAKKAIARADAALSKARGEQV